ncbi:MAG: outer membrane beta-barrel protein [Bacteroidales bacterium]|nr:outer membrane beta-barrel protein [Bacteroidales bacterium]
MKRRFWILVVLMCLAVGARAQVYIINDNLFGGRMSDIRVKVIDSLTNDPVQYASVYVVPAKDTTITNFIISDTSGVATLKEVPYGNYVFHVEMMGYRHYAKQMYFREMRVDLGTIKLQLDENYLSTIVVSDVGNPIVMKKDTIEFNASSFRVGANGMLKDLIKKMPGMEITEDGKVKFNGEAISKLTVGGRTFFFDDQSTALNNLPAAIVDKIRVIDRESEQTRNTGIQDGNREKVMDVELKKEYQEGWFGNVGVKGGTTVGGKKKEELRDNRGFLYNTNALVSAYNKKDQVTVIANGLNIADDDGVVFVVRGDDNSSLRLRAGGQGLSSSAQLGVNVNTTRVKDVETTVSANYKYSDTKSGSKSSRTTFQETGNLFSTSENRGRSFVHDSKTDFEMKKEKGDFWFTIHPYFVYTKSISNSTGLNETFRENIFVNSSESQSRSNADSRMAYLNFIFTFKDLGKKGRNINLALFGGWGNDDGNSIESSILKTSAGEEERTMRYNTKYNYYTGRTFIKYTEPVSDKLTLAASANLSFNESKNISDAFDKNGKNNYYSSESKSHNIDQQYDATAQYKVGKQSFVTFGVTANGTLNRLISRSFNVNDTTGKGEWNWYIAPTLRVMLGDAKNRLHFSVSGSSRKPSNSQMIPVLNINNPSRLSVGNIYLRPYSYTSFGFNWNRNNKQKFTNLMVYGGANLNNKTISNAIWYDSDGIRYSIPVNTKDPSISLYLITNYTTPLDSKKIWSLSLSGTINYSHSTSYQPTGTLPGLDKDTFDYEAFMEQFWGDSKGSRFYSGASGFKKSKTRNFSPTASFNIKYNQKQYSFSFGAGTIGDIYRYSLNKRVNTKTLDTRFNAEGTYTTNNNYEFSTNIGLTTYTGYEKGYGKPIWRWNFEVSKSIGAFILSFKVKDILNQARSRRHVMTENYEEDSYSLIMGRYILFGVKWNFGKMNATQNNRAQRAVWNSVF